jgi:hypothetical protein
MPLMRSLEIATSDPSLSLSGVHPAKAHKLTAEQQ